MEAVPFAIAAELVQQAEELGWPGIVPAYAWWKYADGKTYYKRHRDLTVADCEQLVEYHIRKANAAIRRWGKEHRSRDRWRAGFHILRARLYRCQFFVLTDKHDSTEADMPFSC